MRSVPAATWALCFACLLLPWLNPYAGGPSSSVQPWLVSAACVALASAAQASGRLHPGVPLALAALSVWAIVASGLDPDTTALAGACLLLFVAARMAAGGAREPNFVRVIALSWLIAASVSTAMALGQYFGPAQGLSPWINAAAVGEAFANLRQRNQFASLTVIGMASLLWLSPRVLPRWTAITAMAWLAVGNAATTSRTGLVQMLALTLIALAWPGPRRERATLWLAGLLAYGVAALALPALLEWTTGVAGNRLWDRVAAVDACSSRMVLWSNVLHLIAQKPWLGWGWGNLDYAHYVTLYPGPRFCDILDNAHNLPLHLAVELGLPAALLACGAIVWALGRARPWSESDPARQMAWAVLAVIGFHSLLEYPLWYGPFQIAAGLCVGLLWPASGRRTAPPFSPASVVLAAGIGAACGYAAWDYHRVSQIYLPPEARAPGYAGDPLPRIRQSWLFRQQAVFAELTITPLIRANAQWTFDTARAMLHYSPEPRVIEKLIESAIVLGRDDEALLHVARYRAAFPDVYAKWSQHRPKPRDSAGGAHRPT